MQYNKISSGLLLALNDFEASGNEGLLRQTRTLGLVAPVGMAKPARTVAFIYCDEQADLSHLAEYGVQVNQTQGAVRTAILPLASLDALTEDPAVQRVKPSRYLRPGMDMAATRVKLPAFKTTTGLTGKGVIVGVVDSGIDPNHPAFAGRILRIWDQNLTGPGVPEGGYGLEVMGANLTASRDRDGHGTHVAGIAAGRDATYGGVAPEADLIVVQTDFQDAHIADGVRYVFRIAAAMGRPAVVNLSLGGQADAHDGSDSLSLSIDALVGPGRIVCCAAGNEGNDNIHGQTTVPPQQTATMRFFVPANTTAIALLNGWYSGTGRLEVSLRSPGGFVTPYQPIITMGNPVKTYTLPDAQVEITTPGPDTINQDYNFFVQLRSPQGRSPLKTGIWQLRVRNLATVPTRLDVWTLDGQPSPQVAFTGRSIQDSMKVGAPGAAASAITVAAYTTKNQYVDIDGNTQTVGLTIDTIADFSSEGPLRNGQEKPDVAAPGAMIVSALSADKDEARSQMVNPQYVVLAGTSMACPFVAGLVALLLQRDPTLTPAAIKTQLRQNSLIPAQPPGTFDPKWGYGLVDAEKL
jgi:subtilisin family serine protease